MQATSANVTASNNGVNQREPESVAAVTLAAKNEQKPSKNQMTYDDVELSYVKEDVTKTVVLVGIILAIYAAVWLLMTYTNLSMQILHIFSR